MMEINIQPDDIDKYVKQCILDSTVGKTLTVEIEKGIRDLMSNWNSPIKSFMNKVLDEFTREYMNREELRPLIMEAIAKTITPDVIQKIINYGVTELVRKYDDSR